MWRTVTQRGGGRTASGHRRGMRSAHLLRQGSADPSARRNARRGGDARMMRHAAVIGGQDAKNPPPPRRAERGPRRHQHRDASGQDEA